MQKQRRYLTTEQSARLRSAGATIGDSRPITERRSSLWRTALRRQGLSFLRSPWIWTLIIGLSITSALTTGLALAEFLVGEGGHESNWIKTYGLATLMTVATQGVVVLVSIYLGAALLGFLNALLMRPNPDAPIPVPPRSQPERIGRYAVDIGSHLVALIFFLVLAIVPAGFSVLFSYATLHGDFEREQNVKQEALERISISYSTTHSAISEALETKWQTSRKRPKPLIATLDANLSQRSFNQLLGKMFQSSIGSTLGEVDLGPSTGASEPVASDASYTYVGNTLLKIEGEQQSYDLSSQETQKRIGKLNTEITDIENEINILKRELPVLRQSKNSLALLLRFEEQGCAGSIITQTEANERKVLLDYLIAREQRQSYCSDLPFGEDKKANGLEEFIEALSEAQFEEEFLAFNLSNIAGLKFGPDRNSSLRPGPNCSPTQGNRYKCLDRDLNSTNRKIRQFESELNRLNQRLITASAERSNAQQLAVKEEIFRNSRLASIEALKGGRTNITEKFTQMVSEIQVAERSLASLDVALSAELAVDQGIEAARTALRSANKRCQEIASVLIAAGNYTQREEPKFDLSNFRFRDLLSCDRYTLDPSFSEPLRGYQPLARLLKECSPTRVRERANSATMPSPGARAVPSATSARADDHATLVYAEGTQELWPNIGPPGLLSSDNSPSADPERKHSADAGAGVASEVVAEMDRLRMAYTSEETVSCLRQVVLGANLGELKIATATSHSKTINQIFGGFLTDAGTFTGVSTPRRSIVNMIPALGTLRNGGDWEGHVDEYFALGFAIIIDALVVILGFIVAARAAAMPGERVNPLREEIRRLFENEQRAFNDIMDVVEDDPSQPADWRLVLDPEELTDPNSLPVASRLIALVHTDVWEMPGGVRRYRLSSRLSGALLDEARGRSP